MASLHEKARTRWRSWYFRGWIAMTVVIAALVAVLAPFTPDGPDGAVTVGVFIPPLLILGLGFGIGWLAILVFSRR